MSCSRWLPNAPNLFSKPCAPNAHQLRNSSSQGSHYEVGIAAVLWVSVPLEVRIEKAGSHKVYVSAQKVQWALEPTRRAEGQRLSALPV